MDAISEAASYGIRKDRAVQYCVDAVGTGLNFKAVSNAVSSFRRRETVDESWKAEIEQDFAERGNQ